MLVYRNELSLPFVFSRPLYKYVDDCRTHEIISWPPYSSTLQIGLSSFVIGVNKKYAVEY